MKLTPNAIEYRSLFETRRHSFADIDRIVIESGVTEYRDRFRPFVRMVIRLRSTTPTNPTDVNLKVLPREGVHQMLTYLESRFTEMGRSDVARNLKLTGGR